MCIHDLWNIFSDLHTYSVDVMKEMKTIDA